jgi:putative ABC transport system permease protein
MIISRATLTPNVTEQFLGFRMDQWGLNSAGFAYIVLPSAETQKSMETKFPAFVKKYYEAKDAGIDKPICCNRLSEIHFDTEFSENPGTTSTNSSTLIVLAFIGAFILLVACVNFINLSTALSVHKSKEVGVRKTLGAQRHQLTWQYLSEAFLITLLCRPSFL